MPRAFASGNHGSSAPHSSWTGAVIRAWVSAISSSTVHSQPVTSASWPAAARFDVKSGSTNNSPNAPSISDRSWKQPPSLQDQRQELQAAGDLAEPHERDEARRPVAGDLGVAEHQPGAPRPELRRREARDRAARVMADEADALQAEDLDRAQHGVGV